MTNTFEGLGLPDNIIKAITELNFTEPTPIQQQTIPLLLKQRTDVVALAQTGTGKTAAFGLPLLSQIDFSEHKTKALILAPTRELCVQISADLKKYSKYVHGLKVTEVYGGASIEGQIRTIKQSTPHIIAATPGRLIDLMKRKVVNLQEVEVVVLDEADEMLNMGFKESIDTILEKTPVNKNVWLFSATMPKEVARIASSYMNDPKEVSVGRKNEGAANIEHVYYLVTGRDRYPALKRVVDFSPDIYGIIFCRTKIETQEVADALIKDGYNADSLHGDLSQAQRDFVMKRFRNRNIQLLVATDVAARGIDVKDITHVINYNLPEDTESYTHRSGRTARAGKTGVSIAFVTNKDHYRIKDIERIIHKNFTRTPVPTGVEVCEKQLFHLVNKIHNIEVNEEEIATYLPRIMEELNELSKEDLIKRFVSEEFNRFLVYYQQAPDLNQQGEHRHSNMNRFFVNLGELDGLHWKFMKDYLSDISGVSNTHIFNVDVKKSFSFFETEAKHAQSFLDVNNKNLQFNDRTVQIEVSKGGKEGGGGRREGKSYGGGGKSYGGGGKKFGGNGGGYGGKRRDGGNDFGGERKKREFGGGGFGGKRRDGGSKGKEFGGGDKKREFTVEFGPKREDGGGKKQDFGGKPNRKKKRKDRY